MTPKEIAQLKTQLPALQEALKVEPKLWRFLREGVKLLPAGICQQCRVVDIAPLLETPYNGPYGWCLDCVLHVFQSAKDKPCELYDPYRDPKSPKYDKVYDSSFKFYESFSSGIEFA